MSASEYIKRLNTNWMGTGEATNPTIQDSVFDGLDLSQEIEFDFNGDDHIKKQQKEIYDAYERAMGGIK